MKTFSASAAAILCCVVWAGPQAVPAAEDHLLGPKAAPIRLPVAGGTVLGFTAVVEMGDAGAPGYVAARIAIKSIGTFTADRHFTFVFQTPAGGYSPPTNGLVCEIPISVAQGDTSKQVIRYFPKWSIGDAYRLQVFEDNRLLEDYSVDFGTPVRQRTRVPAQPIATQNGVQWLFIQDLDNVDTTQLPNLTALLGASLDFALFSRMISDPASVSRLTPDQLLGWRPHLTVSSRGELPNDWRGYLRHDVVVMSESMIQRMRDKAPEQWRAMRDWTLSGGTVVAYDAKSDRSTADALDFAVPKVRDNGAVADIAALAQANLKAPRIAGNADEAELYEPTYLSPREWSKRISSLGVGGGLVIGLSVSEASAFQSPMYWRIVRDLVSVRRSPCVRRGVDPLIGDSRFRTWLIPGVAQPPVYTFMGLLTCFVILVGPVAYRRTTKYGRGYLMFAIAPVLAMTTTLAMFGYGIVSDGFGTVARIRQVTWVDGASGDAGERVRATYFAGVRPSSGLTFPYDAEVYPYPENTGESWEDRNQQPWSRLGTMRVTDQAQILDNAFLPSRQQRQFVIFQPRHQIGRVMVKQAATLSEPLTVSSTLDFELRDLIVRDQNGLYWTAERVMPGADGETPCQRVPSKGVSKILGDLYNRYRPLSEFQDSRRRSISRRQTRDLVTAANREIFGSTKVTIASGLLESWLEDNMKLKPELPKSSFVAIADVSEDMVAVEGTELIESARYVFGTLP